MPLDLKALLTGDLNRLRYMGRFSTAHVHHRENVAEHSYYVTLYSYLICDHLLLTGWLKEDDSGCRFVNEVLAKALLHDCEESVTGDMPRMFKYRHAAVRTLVNQAGSREVYRIFKELFPWVKESELGPEKYHADMWTNLHHCWETSKERDTGAVVALADFLSVLAHMMIELETSNWTMQQHYQTLYEHFNTFSSQRFDFLRDLIDVARDMTEEAFKNERTLSTFKTS